MQRSAGRRIAAEGDFVRLPLHPHTTDEKGEFKGVILESLLKDKNLSPGAPGFPLAPEGFSRLICEFCSFSN